MSTCDRCDRPAVVWRRESGRHLCQQHFQRTFEKTFHKELRKQLPAAEGLKVGVALSGGKDSSVLLHLMKKWVDRIHGASIVPILVDEGIPGYRDQSELQAHQLCSTLGLELEVIRYEDEVGIKQVDIAKMDDELVGSSPCAPCGVLRRHLINRAAVRLGLDHLATGHNLDDMAQTVLMNLVRGQPEQIRRVAPHSRAWEGLVPRLVPLRRLPEQEVYLYAHLRKIPFHEGECPLSVTAGRGPFRDIVAALEASVPGTRHGLLNSADRIRDTPGAVVTNQLCNRCAAPSRDRTCKACTLEQQLVQLGRPGAKTT